MIACTSSEGMNGAYSMNQQQLGDDVMRKPIAKLNLLAASALLLPLCLLVAAGPAPAGAGRTTPPAGSAHHGSPPPPNPALLRSLPGSPVGATASSDDDIPGVPIPPSPFTGSVSDADQYDVSSIALTAGHGLTASLTGPSGTDFVLSLYAPGTPSLGADASHIVAVGTFGDYPHSFSYTPTQSGVYYLLVFAYSGGGAYTVTYSRSSPKPGDTVGPVCAAKNVTVTRGKTCTIYFKVHDALSAKVAQHVAIETKSGAVKKSWSWIDVENIAGWWATKYTCRLPKGAYRIVVTGGDLSGNKQSRVGRATLTVK